MYKKVLIWVLPAVILLAGCTRETSKREEDKTVENTVKTETTPYAEEINGQRYEPVIYYRVNKEFDQGGVITTVKDISLYKDEESQGINIICFDLKVTNRSGNDVYMVFDISPIVLSTGEQVDGTPMCEIYRVFKDAMKEGKLRYRIKSSMDGITTIRWIPGSPLYSGSNLMGSEIDYTFNLVDYKKEIVRNTSK